MTSAHGTSGLPRFLPWAVRGRVLLVATVPRNFDPRPMIFKESCCRRHWSVPYTQPPKIPFAANARAGMLHRSARPKAWRIGQPSRMDEAPTTAAPLDGAREGLNHAPRRGSLQVYRQEEEEGDAWHCFGGA